MNANRNKSIDIVKGICIILMVIGHSGPPKVIYDLIYMFHMPCFFIISGMLFKEKYVHDIKKFLLRKGSSLWKPFVIWNLIFILFHNLLVYLNLHKDVYSIGDFYLNIKATILMIYPDLLLSGFWFLTSLMYASIFSLLYYKIVGMSQLKLLFGIALSATIAFLLNYFAIGYHYISDLNCFATTYFITGTFISRIEIKNNNLRNSLAIIAIIVGAISSLFISSEMPTVKYNLFFPYFIISTTMSWGIITVCRNIKVNYFTSKLIKIGECTLDILIFHFLALKLVSLIKIVHYGLPWERLRDFPVIYEENDFYWILYAIFGLTISLVVMKIVHLVTRKTRDGLRDIIHPFILRATKTKS